jgi:Seryl-tRNA synthetase
MIDLIDLKENLELYKKGLSAKGCDVDLADLLKRNSQKNSIQTELDELKSQKNNLSKEIGALTSKGEDTKKLKR